MTKIRNFYINPKIVRDEVHRSIDKARELHRVEKELIQILYDLDCEKFYVRFGYNSLSGFCKKALKLTKIQTQRIVLQVRRNEKQNKNINLYT